MFIIDLNDRHLNNEEWTIQRELTFGTRPAVTTNKTKNITQKYIKMSNIDITKTRVSMKVKKFRFTEYYYITKCSYHLDLVTKLLSVAKYINK